MASKPIAWLIRHGEYEGHDLGVFMSWTDVPLTEKGRSQARDAVAIVARENPKLVFSSPLIRCLAAAEMLSDDVRQDRGLLPWNRGILTGISEEIGKPTLELFMKNPNVTIPMGESRREAEERLEKFFTKKLEDAETEPSAFFTHHSVIDVLNCLLEGKRNENPKNLVKPGGIVAVYVSGDGYKLRPIYRADDEGMSSMS